MTTECLFVCLGAGWYASILKTEVQVKWFVRLGHNRGSYPVMTKFNSGVENNDNKSM